MTAGPSPAADCSRNLHSHDRKRKDVMDKLVRRVTVVQGSGEHRQANVVYNSHEDDDDDELEIPRLNRLERSVRHMLKAQVIAAQEAYQRHIESAAKDGNAWLLDAPGNMMKARRKAMKEMRKSAPFGMPKMEFNDDDDDDKED